MSVRVVNVRSILENNINPAKVMTTNVNRVRGKIILSLVKAAVDGGEELMEDMIKLIPQLVVYSGERVAAKTLVKVGIF